MMKAQYNKEKLTPGAMINIIFALLASIGMTWFGHWIAQRNFYLGSSFSWGMITLGLMCSAFITSFIWSKYSIPCKVFLSGLTIALLVLIIGAMASGAMFNSSYLYNKVAQNVTVIEDSEEVSAFPNLLGKNNDTSNLPVIGIPEAIRKAETEMGRFPALGSQMELKNSDMTSQSINGELKYVIPMQPRSMFKWDSMIGNNGYFIIDRNTGAIEMINTSLKTTTEAPFGSATQRIANSFLRKSGLNALVTDVSPEVDDSGKFHYVATVYRPVKAFSPYNEVLGIVEIDAVTKECKFYDMDNIPEYVDRVYPESFFEDYLRFYGYYAEGWLNSFIGQKNVLKQTKDMEVIYIDGECWYYTGFTTAGKDDSSNGIIMMNSRTGAIEYHVTYGISEERAQKVVQGLVQEKGYTASYPLLLQVGGEETYFMLMRDGSDNLVGYAFCSYKDYTKAAVESTLQKAQTSYLAQLKASGSSSIFKEEDLVSVNGTIENISNEVLNGTTVYYIKVNGVTPILMTKSELDINIVFARVGDHIMAKYYNSGSAVETLVELRMPS